MVKTLKISNKTLSKNQIEMGLKGTGSQEDPVIIDSVRDYKTVLKFKNIEKHILLKNVLVCEIRLVKCMNITISNCKIYHLKLTACHKITIMNSSIVHGYLAYCKNNVFKNNFLDKNRSFHTLEGNQGDNAIKIMQFTYSLPIGCLVFVIIIAFLLNGNLFIFITSLAAIPIFSLPIIDLRIKKHETKNLPDNKFENNEAADLNEISQIYADYRL